MAGTTQIFQVLHNWSSTNTRVIFSWLLARYRLTVNECVVATHGVCYVLCARSSNSSFSHAVYSKSWYDWSWHLYRKYERLGVNSNVLTSLGVGAKITYLRENIWLTYPRVNMSELTVDSAIWNYHCALLHTFETDKRKTGYENERTNKVDLVSKV